MAHPYWRLDLHVTEACNLACPYCYAHERAGAHLAEGDARRALDWLFEASSDKLHVTFWGGEPLLRLGLLEELAAEARQRAARANKRLSLAMPTNATLIDERAIDWIARERVRIYLSIDGGAETQAGRPTHRGDSSHELAAAGLERTLTRRLSPPPAVRMTVTPQSAPRLAEDVAYFVEAGVEALMIYPAIDAAWTAEALEGFARGQRSLARQLTDWLAGSNAKGVVKLRAWLPLLRGLYRQAIGDTTLAPRARRGPLRHCGAGGELVALSVDGSLTPCHRFAFYGRGPGADGVLTLGDLDRGVDPARAATFNELRVEQLARAGGPRCVDCELFELCSFRCLAINYATTGELTDIPPQACALMAAQLAACREVIAGLGADPSLPLYLGLPIATALRAASRELGSRAWALYRGGEDV